MTLIAHENLHKSYIICVLLWLLLRRSFWTQIRYSPRGPEHTYEPSKRVLDGQDLEREKEEIEWSTEGERECSALDHLRHVWKARIRAGYHHVRVTQFCIQKLLAVESRLLNPTLNVYPLHLCPNLCT